MSEFRNAVAKAIEGTPVVDSENGFTVQLDVLDARWWALFARQGLSEGFRTRAAAYWGSPGKRSGHCPTEA
ncbi:hypothetical protein [Arthrobacter sp. SLBN-53]|uniref:hypothetical protein n=1 Tax=Arthrobacter sp. SLBN-53 TaxID=2768412 RepID=UPI00114F5952|nr:hypothetical protein [Arthrobacter sp. SLBN-53]